MRSSKRTCHPRATCFPERVVKLVLLHKALSIYDDEPDVRYDFPKSYLKAVSEGVGDWAIYYEPVKAGPRGYFGVARIGQIVPHPVLPDRYFAMIDPGTFLPFDAEVPRLVDGRPLESSLTAPDGTPKSGGAQQLAVRRLPEAEFARIISRGLPPDLIETETRRYDPPVMTSPAPGLEDPVAPFERPVIERLISRPFRDVAFRRKVRAAYDYRCAMSGLRLRNGGGRPEVQAAHIRPVDRQGSDWVRNGLALSGTLHWMFDRGLVAVADDHTILVSRNKVPDSVTDRLLSPGRRLILPADPQDWPHPANLRWHRENIFGQVCIDAAGPWQ